MLALQWTARRVNPLYEAGRRPGLYRNILDVAATMHD